MTQADRDRQHDFLVRCEEAYNLLQHFLNDTLPWGNVSPETKWIHLRQRVTKYRQGKGSINDGKVNVSDKASWVCIILVLGGKWEVAVLGSFVEYSRPAGGRFVIKLPLR